MDKERLRDLRKEKGETQREASYAIGITETMLSKYELGTESNPTVSTLQAIAGHYGVTVGYLLGETDEKTPA